MDSETGFRPRSALTLISPELNVYFTNCASSFVLVWFRAAYGPRPAPSSSLSSPLSQGQCLSVSKADSIDFRNHSISLSSSHRLATKGERNTPQRKKIDFTRTPQSEKALYLPPNSSRCAKQSRVPLASPPPSSSFYTGVSGALPPSLVQKHSRWAEDIRLLPEITRVRKMWGVFTESCCQQGTNEKSGKKYDKWKRAD